LAGFRLPTDHEFLILAAAGTRTRRYHGDSDELFDRYAWTPNNAGGRAHPVASLLPNDLGLFDTLGNVQEWCQRTSKDGPNHPRQQADLRGGWYSMDPANEIDLSSVVSRVDMGQQLPKNGFRVVRTIRTRRGGDMGATALQRK
jgi:formylglycine-generating enzyme required for sulfatase activity